MAVEAPKFVKMALGTPTWSQKVPRNQHLMEEMDKITTGTVAGDVLVLVCHLILVLGLFDTPQANTNTVVIRSRTCWNFCLLL